MIKLVLREWEEHQCSSDQSQRETFTIETRKQRSRNGNSTLADLDRPLHLAVALESRRGLEAIPTCQSQICKTRESKNQSNCNFREREEIFNPSSYTE